MLRECEFCLGQFVEEKAKSLQVKKDKFKGLASQLLTSTTVKAYSNGYNTLKNFIDHNKLEKLQEWIAWWNDRKSLLILCFYQHSHMLYMPDGKIGTHQVFTWSSSIWCYRCSFNKWLLWRATKWDF